MIAVTPKYWPRAGAERFQVRSRASKSRAVVRAMRNNMNPLLARFVTDRASRSVAIFRDAAQRPGSRTQIRPNGAAWRAL